MDQGQIVVTDELTGTITDAALSSFLQIPSNVGTVTVNSDSVQNVAMFNQISDASLKSVGTLQATSSTGQQMRLPIIMSGRAAESVNPSTQSELQAAIVTSMSSQKGVKLVLPSSCPAELKVPNKKTQGRQRSGVSPSVKQMIAQGVRAKRKTNVVSPVNIIQAQPQTVALAQSVPNVQTQPKSAVISPGGQMVKTVGSEQPVSMSFQTSDGQLITLPVIVKPSPAKGNKVVRTKTKAELKMGVPQNLGATEVPNASISNVNVNTGVLGAVQNIQSQTRIDSKEQLIFTNAQPQAIGNIQIKPQTSTGLQIISGVQAGARTVAITQTAQVKTQPMLTLQTTDAAGNKVMMPVMLNTLTKNIPGTQIKLVPVGYGAGNLAQNAAVQHTQVRAATDIGIPSVVQEVDREPQQQQQITFQQGNVIRHALNVNTSPNEMMVNSVGNVASAANSELAANSQSQQTVQGQDDNSALDTPLISESVIPWLLAPRGNRPVPIKSSSNRKVTKAAKPVPGSPLVANMPIKCPCYCPPECNMSHHPLLVGLLNCLDDPDENVMRQRIQMFSIIFNTHVNTLPDIHDPVPDVLNQYRVPLGHWAAALGRVECFNYLMRRGFKVGSQAKRTRETPLHFALRALPSTCGKDGVEKLQQMMPILGLASLVPNAEGSTSLHVCAELLTIAAKEANRGSETDGNVQFYVKAMSLLLTFTSEKSQELMVRLINSTNLKGDTALHILAGKDNLLKVVTLLVELGADAEIKNFRGATPLSTAIIAKATKIVGYLTSDNVKKHRIKHSVSNQVLVDMLQSDSLTSVDSDMVMVPSSPAVIDGVIMDDYHMNMMNAESEIGVGNNETVTNMLGTVQNTQVIEDGTNQLATMATGNSIIQDAAMMSQIAAATSLIGQPSAVPQAVNVAEDIKPDLGRPIPSVLNTTATNQNLNQTSAVNQPFSQMVAPQLQGDNSIAAAAAKKPVKQTILNPPPNSHVIQFIPPANSQDGKPSTPITVYVNSSDGKPLNLTSNDLLTLTQALQAANIGKEKFPTGPVQVILQQNEGSASKQGNDMAKKVDEVIDVYQNSNQAPVSTVVQRVNQNVGGAAVQIASKPDPQRPQQVYENQVQYASNAQTARSQSQPNSDINQITLDDLTAILKADEHAGGIDFVSTEEMQQPEVDTNAKATSQHVLVAQNSISATQAATQQYIPMQLVGQPQTVTYSQGQVQLVTSQSVSNAQQVVSSTQSKALSYPQVGQLLSRAPLNATQIKTEAGLSRKRSFESGDETSSDTQVIKWAKHDARLLGEMEPNLFPDEAVIKNLKGDDELFDYLKRCDRTTQRDVLASLTEQFLVSQKECDKLSVSIQVVDRDIARVEEIHQDTIENMKVLLNKLSDLEEEDKNLTFESTTFRNEILVCINTQESLRERLAHCDAALGVLNDLMKQRERANVGKSREAGAGDAPAEDVVSDDESDSGLSDLDSSRHSDVEEERHSKAGLLPPIVYGENGSPIEDAADVNLTDVELYTKDQASARIKSEENGDKKVAASSRGSSIPEESATDVEFTEGSTLNTTMESADLDEPRSPTDTLPIESIDYQDLGGFQRQFSSSRDDLLLLSQGSNRSGSSFTSLRVAQVVPGSQETIVSMQGSLYGTQGSRMSSQSSTFSSLESQSSLLPSQDGVLDHHSIVLSSQEIARSEECISSQESFGSTGAVSTDDSLPNSQELITDESAPNSQNETVVDAPEELHEGTSGQAEILSEVAENTDELIPNSQSETNAELPSSSPQVVMSVQSEDFWPRSNTDVDTAGQDSLQEIPCQSDVLSDVGEHLSESQEVTSTDKDTTLSEEAEVIHSVTESTNVEDLNLLPSQDDFHNASEELITSSQDLPNSSEVLEIDSQELLPESMEVDPDHEEIPADSVAMVPDADDTLLLSQDLVSSSQEGSLDSQGLAVLTQRSVNNTDMVPEIDTVFGENEVESSVQNDGSVEVVSIENDGHGMYEISLDDNGQQLYVMSEPTDSEDIEFVSEEIQFVTQDSSVSSQDFVPVSLEEGIVQNIDQGLYSQNSDTLNQDLLVGSQELIEDESDNLIVSQDILAGSQGAQEFVVASNFDEFLV